MKLSKEVSTEVKLEDLSCEIYVKGGNSDDLKLLFNAIDKLRNEYGINVYIKFFDGGWLYGDLDDELKIVVRGKEIKVKRGAPNLIVERLVDEILIGISSLNKSVEEPIFNYQEGPGKFSSAEYLVTAA